MKSGSIAVERSALDTPSNALSVGLLPQEPVMPNIVRQTEKRRPCPRKPRTVFLFCLGIAILVAAASDSVIRPVAALAMSVS